MSNNHELNIKGVETLRWWDVVVVDYGVVEDVDRSIHAGDINHARLGCPSVGLHVSSLLRR